MKDSVDRLIGEMSLGLTYSRKTAHRAHDVKRLFANTEDVMFEKKFYASWGDMDYNSHMRNTAYLDKAADIRMMFLSDHGFPMSEFARLRIGPVITKDEIEYYREINLLDELTVDLRLAGLSEDGSRWVMRSEFFGPDAKLSARVTSMGAWLDLSARRTVAPPDALLALVNFLPKTDDFRLLETRIK